MKAVVSWIVLLGVCAVLGAARQTTRPNGEEGRIIALESAWDQAEQNKDAAALANLLADNIVYVDYDGWLHRHQTAISCGSEKCRCHRRANQQRRRDRALTR